MLSVNVNMMCGKNCYNCTSDSARVKKKEKLKSDQKAFSHNSTGVKKTPPRATLVKRFQFLTRPQRNFGEFLRTLLLLV